MTESLSEKIDRLIKELDNMSVDDLEALFNKYGYYPKRKPEYSNIDKGNQDATLG